MNPKESLKTRLFIIPPGRRTRAGNFTFASHNNIHSIKFTHGRPVPLPCRALIHLLSVRGSGPPRFLTMSSTAGVSEGGPGGSASDRITITESNLNPVLQIVTWLLLAFTSLVLSFRLFTNIIVKGRMPVTLEDLLFLSSFVCIIWHLSLFSNIRSLTILGLDFCRRRVCHDGDTSKQYPRERYQPNHYKRAGCRPKGMIYSI